jgi:geranylgeranylglycerol-phosphate geranylgeranyltransferase
MLDLELCEASMLKQRLLAHIETCRPYTLAYAGLVSLAGALLASRDPELWRLLGAWAVPTLGWLAALYGGDYFDRYLDAVAKPHRPIPSGRMSAQAAFAIMVINIALGMAVAVLLNPYLLIVATVTVVLGILYSNVFKARGLSGNVVRGALTALAFIFGTMTTSRMPPIELLPLALVFWLHDAESNLVGTLRDVDGDRLGGYQTLPVRHGIATTLRVVTILYALWLAWATGYPIVARLQFDLAVYSQFLGAAATLGLASLIMLFRSQRPLPRLSALRAHEILIVERLVLAAAFIAAASTYWLALALLVPCVVATLASQFLLRRRYEIGVQV